MDQNPAKRRKLEHQEPNESTSNGSAALEAAATAGTSRPSTFVLQTQELLKEVRVNYTKYFSGADEFLHRVKSTIEGIGPQGPTPVSFLSFSSAQPPSALALISPSPDLPSFERPQEEA